MKKLYRYRPLSDFLFKELYYQELYFASYGELNDPLDLSARIEFSFEEEHQVAYLIHFLYKSTLKLSECYSDKVRLLNSKLLSFIGDKDRVLSFRKSLVNNFMILKQRVGNIWYHDVECCVAKSIKEENIDFDFDLSSFKSELNRITEKFLANSHVTCFSETNDNFLMWSHYASKHSGVCLEFSLINEGLFPYAKQGQRNYDDENYKQRISEWHTKAYIYWERLRRVTYEDKQPFINFYDFSPVFENENDCDLIGLSKPWTHELALQLELAFSTKTKPWDYEKEWRAIEINFSAPKEPEDRIRHFPIECLSAIYFGSRTPETAKKRIFRIFDSIGKSLNYFDTKPANGRELEFSRWEYYED